jgi:hypothetical protein
MGLDVYLYKYTNKPAFDAWNKRKEEAGTACWDKLKKEHGKEFDYALYKSACEAWEKENPCPDGASETKIEIDSKVYPEHMFKIGYLRSSYNDSGINNNLRKTIGMDLAYIFGVARDEYEIAPDWGACLTRAREVKSLWEQHLKDSGGKCVMQFRFNMFRNPAEYPANEQAALAEFLKTAAREHAPFDEGSKHIWFSAGNGEYFLGESLNVHAVFPGTDKSWRGTVEPCFYVITDRPKDTDGKDWHLKALEIVVEMCEWVLGQDDPKAFWLLWSG